MATVKVTPEMVEAAMNAVDWEAIDSMTDEDIARQIAENPDAPPDLSDAPPEMVFPVHPPGGVNVRGIRAKLGMTQAEFAERYGFALGSVRDWEQGRKQPEAATRTLLFVIEVQPDLVAKVVTDHREAA